MIEKLFPRALNSSSDNRLKKKTEMNDAYNVVVTEDFNDFNASTSTGNEGVLKPVKGNVNQDGVPANLFEGQANRRVLGSVSDARTGVVYFFVFSERPSEMGVYAYDTTDYLGSGNYVYVPVFRTPEFNFQEDSVVQGDVVHVSGDGGEFRPILYFTDNVNEPRKLDVLRARAGVDYADNSIHQKDFITACPKAPMNPITFEFATDSDRRISDFRRVPGFQFAYQCIYISGEESAISTYSDIAVPPAYLNQGSASSASLFLDNVCNLTIPALTSGVFNHTEEIESIRILVRKGNAGAFFVVDEIPRGTAGTASFYSFYNDQVLTGVTTEEEQKQFDSLPRVAQALSVVENRLFYGNYVEGYDETTVDANLTVSYLDRPENFFDVDISVTPKILPKAPIESLDNSTLIPNSDAGVVNRTAGYQIDTSGLEDTMPADTVISFQIEITPGGNFDLYDSTESYHAGRRVGFSTANSQVPIHTTFANTYGQVFGGQTIRSFALFGNNAGVNQPSVRWKTTEGDEDGADVKAVYGTSAANAFKLKKSNLTFSVTLRTEQALSDAPNQIRDAICAAFDESKTLDSSFSILAIEDEFTYTYNLGFEDPDGSDPDTAVLSGFVTSTTGMDMNSASDREKSKLIVAVGNNTGNGISEGGLPAVENYKAPCGYFVVNQATVQFRLRQLSALTQGSIQSAFLAPEISGLSGVDVRTCIPVFGNMRDDALQDIRVTKPHELYAWRVFSKEYLSANEVSGEFTQDNEHTRGSYLFKGTGNTLLQGQLQARRKALGYLDFESDADLYVTNELIREGIFDDTPPIGSLDAIGVSLMDGEGTFRVKRKNSTSTLNDAVGSINVNTNFTTNIESASRGYGFTTCFTGIAVHIDDMLAGGSESSTGNGYPYSDQGELELNVNVSLGLLAGNINKVTLSTNPETMELGLFEQSTANSLAFKEGDLEEVLRLEAITNAFADQSDLSGSYRTFKTYANHDFGVVYYDERGRPGNVNRIGSAYVEGYSNQERGEPLRGRAEVNVEFLSDPPTWAHHYQIVYAGNSSVRDFIQYSAGGAYYSVDSEEGTENNIYVSLNYLQSNADVSYSGSFGAVAADGTQNLYVYSPGDLLRVISYNTTAETVIYPNAHLFEVVDVVDLGSDVDENPLVSSGDVPDHLQGQFVVVKDQPTLNGFSFNSVVDGGNEEQSSFNFWNNRCIIEISSPKSSADPEDRVYHEIGEVYNVGRNGLGVYHQTPSVTLRNGDVWWRRVAVNIADYDVANDQFLNLIQPDDGGVSESRFRNYYLESSTFNDTFPGNNVNGFGKRKFISSRSNEVRRFSSVTYSDRNDYSSSRIRYTSFNPYNAPFKDLPNEHGNINVLLNFSDSLFVVQEDKASAVPVSRTVLSDALGQDTLIGSDKILGNQKFYAGSYGSDNNPESVIKVENNIYFAHKSKGEVYRFNPSNGIDVISRKGMNSFFRDAFQDAILGAGAVRVVSGYDPLKDEYLITISNFPALTQPSVSLYTQPNVALLGPPVVPTGDGTGGGTGGGDNTGGEINIGGDFVNDIVVPINDFVDELAEPSPGSENVQQLKEDIELVIEGSGLGTANVNSHLVGLPEIIFDPVTFATSVLATIDMSSFIPQSVADALGDLDLSISPTSSASQGTYISSQNIIQGYPTVISGLPTDFVPSSWGAAGGLTSPSVYPDFIQESGVVVGQDGKITLREALETILYRQTDLVALQVAGYKGAEDGISSLDAQIDVLLAEVDTVIDAADLGSDPNVAVLRTEAGIARDVLTNHLENVLKHNTPIVLDVIDDSIPSTYNGFGVFDVTEYPINDAVNLNALDTLKRLVVNLNDSLGALLNFQSVDLSQPLSRLIDSNASLRDQVEILTDQIQELSISTDTATLNTTLIEGVNTSQLNTQTISNLSGNDGLLTSNDVVRNLSAEVEFIVTNVIQNAVDTALENTDNSESITEDAAKKITARVIREVFKAAGLDKNPATQFNDPASFYQIHRVDERIIENTDDTSVINQLATIINPFDTNTDGFINTTDFFSNINSIDEVYGRDTFSAASGTQGQAFAELISAPASEAYALHVSHVQSGKTIGLEPATEDEILRVWFYYNREIPEDMAGNPTFTTLSIFVQYLGLEGAAIQQQGVVDKIANVEGAPQAGSYFSGVAPQSAFGASVPTLNISSNETNQIVSNVLNDYLNNG